ncbi:hypothetical protein GCM10010389_41340 [Streptomyces echinoruber]|uniref:Uncharacterized protein n=1 Tax=Streptomyces echinoruber TaxID=68898 RepID=A0A918RHC0_9ACTN|nr:hypothetical protein GCM10010389_41340 [Streptomyces echinoruber]
MDPMDSPVVVIGGCGRFGRLVVGRPSERGGRVPVPARDGSGHRTAGGTARPAAPARGSAPTAVPGRRPAASGPPRPARRAGRPGPRRVPSVPWRGRAPVG